MGILVLMLNVGGLLRLSFLDAPRQIARFSSAGGLTPSHRSGVVESLTARFAWQEDDHYGHEKKEVA